MAWCRWRGAGVLLVAVAVAGCSRTPLPESTGAEEAVRGYYEAILRQDWAAAYAFLHPDSRQRCGADEFARLAKRYRRDLGFEPAEVRVRSCEVHGDEAVAHIVFTGQASSKHHYFKDAVTLRQGGAGWGVILPTSFGQKRLR